MKFFPDKAGLAGGIATASYGISSVLIPPVATAMIDGMGVSRAFMVLGIVIVVVVVVFSQFIIKCPDDFVPEGLDSEAEEREAAVRRQWRTRTGRGMLSSPVFYVMIIMLFFGAVLGNDDHIPGFGDRAGYGGHERRVRSARGVRPGAL